MSKSKMLSSLFAVAFAASLGLARTASAAKKGDLWAGLRNLQGQNGQGGSLRDRPPGKRGAGCMKKYGYRLWQDWPWST